MIPMFLSFPLAENTPAYGGETGSVSFRRIRSISNGDNSNNLVPQFPNHIGTHIDFPYHFNNDGKTCDAYPASFWVFNKVGFLACSVEELPQKIYALPADIELLILITSFGAKRHEEVYWAAQPVIPASLARILREAFPQLRVFGFDMISLTSKLDRAEGKKAHIAFLLEHEILVLEDMKLDELETTPSVVIILPLQIMGADGAPCSIIANQ